MKETQIQKQVFLITLFLSYRNLRKKLQNKINNLRNKSIFEEIADLPEDKFKEFEFRTRAFLNMNT